ncbi:MAG: hypothetical protein N0C84_16945 [Candidatus Thiodiazotropha taylori]|uniref:Uncharacterized protein n=1 Tax=Candidatus Thiodiazotropha taylori TaxID=2792791 RepID=A0A9E4T1Q0_9GAMM|nr:hypothetical protein [Candidatus Thiodiazotropha taylori]MCW4258154.1 hypothetical protein [Candidatus Thiodiazotropha taylori]
MLVRATKLGYYSSSLRYPGKQFDYEHSPKKGEKLSAAELKAKTKEDVDNSDWMEPVKPQKAAKAAEDLPPKESANNQDKKPAGESNDKSQAE